MAEWKSKAEDKVSTEWKAEKELLEKQLGMARTQMEENRKLYESLKFAIDKNATEDSHDQAHLLEVNKVYPLSLRRIFLIHWDVWRRDHKYWNRR